LASWNVLELDSWRATQISTAAARAAAGTSQRQLAARRGVSTGKFDLASASWIAGFSEARAACTTGMCGTATTPWGCKSSRSASSGTSSVASSRARISWQRPHAACVAWPRSFLPARGFVRDRPLEFRCRGKRRLQRSFEAGNRCWGIGGRGGGRASLSGGLKIARDGIFEVAFAVVTQHGDLQV